MIDYDYVPTVLKIYCTFLEKTVEGASDMNDVPHSALMNY